MMHGVHFALKNCVLEPRGYEISILSFADICAPDPTIDNVPKEICFSSMA